MNPVKTTLTKLSVQEAKATIDELNERGIAAKINMSIEIIDGGLNFVGPERQFEQVTMSEVTEDEEPSE